MGLLWDIGVFYLLCGIVFSLALTHYFCEKYHWHTWLDYLWVALMLVMIAPVRALVSLVTFEWLRNNFR